MRPTYINDPPLKIGGETWTDPVPVVLVNGSFSIGGVTLSGEVKIQDAFGNTAEIPKANAAKTGDNHVVLVQNIDDEGGVLRRSDIVDIDLNTATTNVALLNTNSHLAAIEDSGTRGLAAINQQLTSLFTIQSLLAAMRPGIIVTAAEQIDKYVPVTANGSVANSSDVSTFGKVIGVAVSAASVGQPFEVALSGEVVNSSWAWLTGQTIFVGVRDLSDTAALSGYSQQVGTAKNSTTIVVSVQQPIQL